MGFSESVRTVLKLKYATFSGRASRSEFWWFQLFYSLVLMAFAVVVGIAIGASFDRQAGPSALVIAIGVIGGLFALAMLLPQISLMVRRFHDRNISGWWYLALTILGFIPYLGIIAGIAIFVITVLRGTDGPNKFGADPLRPDATAAVFA